MSTLLLHHRQRESQLLPDVFSRSGIDSVTPSTSIEDHKAGKGTPHCKKAAFATPQFARGQMSEGAEAEAL